MIAVPEVGARKPVIIFIVVDLPAPFGPRKPSTSPRGTVNEMSSTALSGPKCLTRCRISSIAGWSPIVRLRPMLPSVGIAERLYQHDGSFVPFRRICAPRAMAPERRPDKRSRRPMTRGLVLALRLAGSLMIARLRLISGLVMLAYVAMHLLNHAVGLISLKAMEDVLWYIFRIWTNRPAQALLYGSFFVHYALALSALWRRRTLRLRTSELAQLILGFAIPLLLVRHVVGTRISDSFFHTDAGYYAHLLWIYFVRLPDQGYLQMLVLVVAWAHAMIGLHFWLRVRPWYARLQPAALIVAVLVPVLSLLGMIEAGGPV